MVKRGYYITLAVRITVVALLHLLLQCDCIVICSTTASIIAAKVASLDIRTYRLFLIYFYVLYSICSYNR